MACRTDRREYVFFKALSQNYEKQLLASSCVPVCPSIRLSVCPHGTTRLPLDGYSWNLIFEYFSKIRRETLANNQLDALFHVFIYFISLHVSSTTVLIIRLSNCINTSSGMFSLCKWLLSMAVRRDFPPDRLTKQSLAQTNHTRWCSKKIRYPARNM